MLDNLPFVHLDQTWLPWVSIQLPEEDRVKLKEALRDLIIPPQYDNVFTLISK